MRRHWLALQRGQMLNGQAEYRIVRDDGSPVNGMVLFEARRPWGRLKRPDRCEIDSDGSIQALLEPGRWIVRVFDAGSDAPVLVREVEVTEAMKDPLLLVVQPK